MLAPICAVLAVLAVAAVPPPRAEERAETSAKTGTKATAKTSSGATARTKARAKTKARPKTATTAKTKTKTGVNTKTGTKAGTGTAVPAPASPDAFNEPPSVDPVLNRILARLQAEAGPLRAGDEQSRGAIRRIIVDPGHGGHDTGAIGPTGVLEKDVVLAVARRLARRLRSAGFEVVLTRDDDRSLALDERAAMANARGGDLFLSIHANAHPRRRQTGVETYVLDVASDRYAKRLAARENGSPHEDELPEVRRILADLDAKASAGPSRRLAESVQRELTGGIRARFGDVRDLGVKSALFYVLLGARMPAVLVETSFISNRAEERRLASAAFQDELAAGLERAVRRFAAREARVASR